MVSPVLWFTLEQYTMFFNWTKPSRCLRPVCSSPFPWWQALLEGVPYGQAAVVEVADELRVDGAAELRNLSVCGRDEDTLHCFHQNIVEECVLHSRCEL